MPRLVSQPPRAPIRGTIRMDGGLSTPTMPLCVIVDDHDDSREGFAEYLQASGVEVLAAADAEQFEALVAERTPDAIVLDLQLPRLDGWQLARRVRSEPRLASVPLVAVTACVMPDERARAEGAGFDLFLPKPVDPEVVLKELLRLIASREP